MNLSTAACAPGSSFATPETPGGTSASFLSAARIDFIGSVDASAAACTCQMSSAFVSTAVNVFGLPAMSITSIAHAECPPGDATTSSEPDRSSGFFFAFGSSCASSATRASARVPIASPRRGPNTINGSTSSDISPSVSPWPIDS